MPSLEKATITNTLTGERVSVLFNPEEYTVNREVNFAQTSVPGLSAPIIQFVNGNAETLDMELFLDTNEMHRSGSRVLNQRGDDVRALVSQITHLMQIAPQSHAPPVLLFTWASLSFTCVLSKASQRYVMFLADGRPVRARLQVTFTEFRNVDLEAKEIKRQTADYTKRHVVRDGETLSGIAAMVYGDPAKWRPIAIRNRIDAPRRIAVGSALEIPPLPFRDPETGVLHG
jgi:nucleoid-associated protein YgaU